MGIESPNPLAIMDRVLARSWLPGIINKNTDLMCGARSYVLLIFNEDLPHVNRKLTGADATCKCSIESQ